MEHRERASFGLTELKFAKGGSVGAFSGYGAVFNNEDHGGDVILPGAFRDTLASWKSRGKLPKMLWQHGYDDNQMPVGVWTSMEEDDKGLHVEGQLIALDTDRGRQLHAGMKSGAIDAMSITYVAQDVVYGTKDGDARRTIRRLDLYEVGPVLFGMNELAQVDGVKVAQGQPITLRKLENILRDAGVSKSLAARIATAAKSVLSDQRDADDEAAELVSALQAGIDLISKSTTRI